MIPLERLALSLSKGGGLNPINFGHITTASLTLPSGFGITLALTLNLTQKNY